MGRFTLPGALLLAVAIAWVGLSGHDTRDLHRRALAARDGGDLEAAGRLIDEAAEANEDVDDPGIRVHNRFEIETARATILFASERPAEASGALEQAWRLVSERQLGTGELREAVREVRRIADAHLGDEALAALQRSFTEQSLAVAREHPDDGSYGSDFEHQLFYEIELLESRFGRDDRRLVEPLLLWADQLHRRGAHRDADEALRRARTLRDRAPQASGMASRSALARASMASAMIRSVWM